MTTYTPPRNETIACALLTIAAHEPDTMMLLLCRNYQGGDIIALAKRLQEIAIYYEKHSSLPTYDDITSALGLYERPAHQDAMRIEKILTRWATHIKPYATMSFNALSCTLTRNYTYWITSPYESEWPQQLDDLSVLTDTPAPLCLWGVGSKNALMSCTAPVSIVGSRNVDSYGRIIAHTLGKTVARQGHTVISGGALGADSAAQWGAVAADEFSIEAGRTISVMAGGLDYIGPQRNSTLFQRILEYDGAVISELPYQTVPEPYRFLQRNRIIAALGAITIVAQAQHRSGALNTATWAADLNRIVLAAPGNINTPYNTGCNRLIYDGKANILVSARDLDDFCHPPHDRIIPATGTEPNPLQG